MKLTKVITFIKETSFIELVFYYLLDEATEEGVIPFLRFFRLLENDVFVEMLTNIIKEYQQFLSEETQVEEDFIVKLKTLYDEEVEVYDRKNQLLLSVNLAELIDFIQVFLEPLLEAGVTEIYHKPISKLIFKKFGYAEIVFE